MEALNRNEHKPKLITLRFLKNVMQANLKTNVTRTQTMSNFPKKTNLSYPLIRTWFVFLLPPFLFSFYLLLPSF